MVEFFGGEPTLREDLIALVVLARKYGLKPRVVTNGIRLADEAYCRELCDTRIRLRLAFDGRHPEIYTRLRRNPSAYEKELQALENLARYSHRPHAILACVARRINDQYMSDLIAYCHQHMETVDSLGLIKTIPACSWYMYRNNILKKIAGRYGTAAAGEWPI